ncbi:energy transducer TonB [Geothrix sp. 21YS21S-4]|uniref:energy transducer TonB n=1 Tax=Geothrix sp. 21YS21S-4 TaxID=3068889 RepID=UPI0027B8D5BE|nr:energy transducer TonB [Geothrix sp. 21YS21S-4]
MSHSVPSSFPVPVRRSTPESASSSQAATSLEDLVYVPSLLGPNAPLRRGNRGWAMGLSLAIYGILGTGVVIIGAQSAELVATPRIVSVDLIEEIPLLAPPPPPPPAPVTQSSGPVRTAETTESQPIVPEVPTEIPVPSTPVASFGGSGVTGGVPGGVAGGVAGGAVGGVVGGTVGGIVPPKFDAAYLQNPAPDYPSLSRRLREEGRVVLRVLVKEDGSPERIELKQTSGHNRLDQAALDAVRRWRFTPARRGSDQLAAWVLVPLSFSLEA